MGLFKNSQPFLWFFFGRFPSQGKGNLPNGRTSPPKYVYPACSSRFHRQDVMWKSSAVATGSCCVSLIVAFMQQGAVLLLRLLFRCNGKAASSALKAVHLQQGAALLVQLLLSCLRELLCYFNCCFVAGCLSRQVESKTPPEAPS